MSGIFVHQLGRLAGRCCALLCLLSAAFGQSWNLDPITGPGYQDAQIAIANNGAIHVVYRQSTGSGFFDVYYATKDAPSSSWSHQLILAAPAEGTSLALDPSGFPHISYYDGASWIQWGTPHHLWRDGNGWHDEQVDTLSCGYNSAIAVDSAGDVHVLYRQEVGGSLWYRAKLGGVWSAPEVVDNSSDPGRYCVLRTDSSNQPRAAYSTWSPSTEPRYAFRDPVSGWQSWSISTSSNTFRQVSMALDSLDQPNVLYHDNVSGTIDDLHFAVSTDGGATWQDATIYSPGGRYASIVLDSQDMPQVVTETLASGVHFLSQDSGGAWSQSYIADGGLAPGGASIALDPQEQPHIALTGPNGEILIASPPHPTLSVTGLVAGGTVTISVSGCTPNGKVRHGYSFAGGGPVGTQFGNLLLSPPYTELAPMTMDAAGTGSYSRQIPPGATGISMWFHAFDLGSLTFTNGIATAIG